METPCIKVCKVSNGKCLGCGRTLEQIRLWSRYSDEERESIMSDLRGYKKMPSVYTKNDWEWEVIDVLLEVNGTEFHISGFDDVDWEQANEFAQRFADTLKVPFLGGLD